MKLLIGQEVEISEGFPLESVLAGKTVNVKKGDKGVVDSNGFIHYISGEARGKIQKFADVELNGYDVENISKLIYKRLDGQFGIDAMLEDNSIGKEDFIAEIEYILSDIL